MKEMKVSEDRPELPWRLVPHREADGETFLAANK